MVRRFLFLGLTLVLLQSCDYFYDYTYQISNRSDQTVTIQLTASRFDSSYVLQPNETRTLFITHHGIEGSKGPYYSDVSSDITNLIIKQGDTTSSKRDYTLNASWNYEEGLYHTVIHPHEFN